MNKIERSTDLWVYDLLRDAGVHLEAEKSSIEEIANALKTASKNGKGNIGFPEYIGVVKDFIIVIEDKPSVSQHIKLDDHGHISQDPKDVTNCAVNGALHYARHLAQNTTYNKVIAFGVSGNEKRHRISPIYVDETDYYRELPDVESFVLFNEENIDELYQREVLKESTDTEKELSEILKDAAELHDALLNHGKLKEADKPLIVSGILLALREIEFKGFSLDELNGDRITTDGTKIYNAIRSNLERSAVKPEAKKDKILNQFTIIKDTQIINDVSDSLGKTPLKYFAEFLYAKIYRSIKYSVSSEDYIGRFYGEFMSYSGGDAKNQGIVLTPKHITDLFCDILDLREDDVVLDPCAGTGGFLIAAMHSMLNQTDDEARKKSIRQKQLHGFEIQPYMFTIATTNMILRGDGKSNLINHNFLAEDPAKLQKMGATVGMMNPPYNQGKNGNEGLTELAFIEQMLDSLTVGARAAAIVPLSTMYGKTKADKEIKANILTKHTLEGVITLNEDTFCRGAATSTCLVIFTVGEAHPKDKICKFIDFKDDGYVVSPHKGLIETPLAKDKKQHLLDVWFDRIESQSDFCVKTTIRQDDEWLYSFYYFNDAIPSEEVFDSTLSEYLTFQFAKVMEGRGHLFDSPDEEFDMWTEIECHGWREFFIGGDEGVFSISGAKSVVDYIHLNVDEWDADEKGVPYITRKGGDNGIRAIVPETQPKNVSLNEAGAITIGTDTQTAFYQPHAFFTGRKVPILRHSSLNRWSGLFIAALLKIQIKKFAWANGATPKRLCRSKIMLPVDEAGNPDFHYMTQYMMNLETRKRSLYLNTLKYN